MRSGQRAQALAFVVATAAAGHAQATSAAAALRSASEARASADIASLFQTLCPDQCVLLSVSATVDEQATSGGDPGFEAVTGEAHVPVLQALNAAVLVDAGLPAAFRARVRDLLTLRLKALGATSNDISVDSVAFPPRIPPAPPSATPPGPASPATTAAPVAAAPQPLPAQVASGSQPALRARLIDAAPSLAAIGILAAALLVLGALLLVATRRPDAFSTPSDEQTGETRETGSALTTELYPALRVQRLEKVLTDERGLRNEVVRAALARGEATLVARWVRDIGELIVADLQADPGLSSALHQVAGELAKDPGIDPSERTKALSELESRVLSTRLSRTVEPAETQFAFLEGVRPESFLTAWRAVTPGARETVLRFAPAPLRETALRQLSPMEHAELALAWARRPSVTPAYAAAVATEWRSALASCASTASQAERALSGLLALLPRAEQDSLVDRLRREGVRLSPDLPRESMLLQAPVEAVATAALSLPPERLGAYLARADAELRDFVLTCCPARLQRELQADLLAGIFVTREDFLSARNGLLEALRQSLLSAGVTPVDPHSDGVDSTGRTRLNAAG